MIINNLKKLLFRQTRQPQGAELKHQNTLNYYNVDNNDQEDKDLYKEVNLIREQLNREQLTNSLLQKRIEEIEDLEDWMLSNGFWGAEDVGESNELSTDTLKRGLTRYMKTHEKNIT